MMLRKILLATGCMALLGSSGSAQATGPEVRFAAPRQINAGDTFLGDGRYFPSPVLHDMNGDGRADIVVGDLMGRVTYAPRIDGESGVTFGPEVKLLDRDGKELDFSNW